MLVVCNNLSIRIRADSGQIAFSTVAIYSADSRTVFTKFRAGTREIGGGVGREVVAATRVEFMRRFHRVPSCSAQIILWTRVYIRRGINSYARWNNNKRVSHTGYFRKSW